MRAPKLETVDEMLDRIGTTREWAIDRVLAVGSLSMLIGRPGAGKSILAQMMAAGEPTDNEAPNIGG